MKAVSEKYSAEKSRMNHHFKAQMILQRISSGDKSAVEDCVNAYGSAIWTLAKKYTETVAENTVLDIFGDLWKYAPNFSAIECDEINFIALVARRRLSIHRGKICDE